MAVVKKRVRSVVVHPIINSGVATLDATLIFEDSTVLIVRSISSLDTRSLLMVDDSQLIKPVPEVIPAPVPCACHSGQQVQDIAGEVESDLRIVNPAEDEEQAEEIPSDLEPEQSIETEDVGQVIRTEESTESEDIEQAVGTETEDIDSPSEDAPAEEAPVEEVTGAPEVKNDDFHH